MKRMSIPNSVTSSWFDISNNIEQYKISPKTNRSWLPYNLIDFNKWSERCVGDAFQMVEYSFETKIHVNVVVEESVRVLVCVFQSVCKFQGTKILDHFPNWIAKMCDSQIWPQSLHLFSLIYLIFNQTHTHGTLLIAGLTKKFMYIHDVIIVYENETEQWPYGS